MQSQLAAMSLQGTPYYAAAVRRSELACRMTPEMWPLADVNNVSVTFGERKARGAAGRLFTCHQS